MINFIERLKRFIPGFKSSKPFGDSFIGALAKASPLGSARAVTSDVCVIAGFNGQRLIVTNRSKQTPQEVCIQYSSPAWDDLTTHPSPYGILTVKTWDANKVSALLKWFTARAYQWYWMEPAFGKANHHRPQDIGKDATGVTIFENMGIGKSWQMSGLKAQCSITYHYDEILGYQAIICVQAKHFMLSEHLSVRSGVSYYQLLEQELKDLAPGLQ